MALSLEQLQAVAARHWRADKAYEGSPEHKRLTDLWDEKLEKMDPWWALLDGLKAELPGFTVGDATATPDASFRCAVYSPVNDLSEHRFIVVGCVSILAPVYTVYAVEYVRLGKKRHNPRVVLKPLLAEMEHPADVVARKIEAAFEVSALPRGIAAVRIPLYVEPVEPPETTLFHALFTSEPESLP